MTIPFKLGPSRQHPYRDEDRITPPAGIEVPRPFDIQHQWRQPAGRSTGGFFHLTAIERMVWVYRASGDTIYTRLMQHYSPVNPWVWVYFLPPDGTPTWFEAALQEPAIGRGVGTTIQSVSLTFHSLVRYDEG